MKPSPTDISDLINEVALFVSKNPYWYADDGLVAKLGVAYHILTTISDPEMVTDEEYEFVIDIHNTIKARSAQ
jgi:hypothetical protein